MNSLAAEAPVKAFDGQSSSCKAGGIRRETLDIRNGEEAAGRNLHTGGARQFEHDEFVFGHCREVRGGEFDDPRSADALGRNGESAVGLDEGGKLELDSGEREAERTTAARRKNSRSEFTPACWAREDRR